MTLKMLSKPVRGSSDPLESSRTRPTPAEEYNAVLSRKQDHVQKSESDKNRDVPVECDAEQASVMGEAERPAPPSEKPEASGSF